MAVFPFMVKRNSPHLVCQSASFPLVVIWVVMSFEAAGTLDPSEHFAPVVMMSPDHVPAKPMLPVGPPL
jgi:hypothetical protein